MSRAPPSVYAADVGLSDEKDAHADAGVVVTVQPAEVAPPPPTTAPPPLPPFARAAAASSRQSLTDFRPALPPPPRPPPPRPPARVDVAVVRGAGDADDDGDGGGDARLGELSVIEAKDADAPHQRETHDDDAPMYAAADAPVLDATEAHRLALLAINVRDLRISINERSILSYVNDTIARRAKAGDFHCAYPRGVSISDNVRAILYARGFLPGLDPQTGEPILMW